MATTPPRPVAFVVSVAAGVLGAVLIVAGLLTGNNVVYGAGFAMGVVSLVAALTWRSELVSAWRANRR